MTYNVRNVLVRWRATLATVLGVGLVVWVYMMMQSLAAGLEKSSSNTGDARNVMIVRKGSTAESSSQITREQFRLIPYLPEVAQDDKGQPLISADVVVLMNLPRRENKGEAHVLFRGVSPKGIELRPQVTLTNGHWFTPGQRQVVVSGRLAKRFLSFNVGDRIKSGVREFTVVGQFDARNSAFDSEVWMDADEARAVFDREMYSSVLVRAAGAAAMRSLTNRIETDKRLPLRALPETAYYASQTMTARPIKFLGNFLATAMSIGAVFAAMNTMYASVGARTREIGTLRVLGYRRRSILLSFLIEGAFLALIGGALGCLIAVALIAVSELCKFTIGTISFETFSETIFQLRITPLLAMKGLVFSVAVGLAGSFLPALRASRMPVIAALKAV